MNFHAPHTTCNNCKLTDICLPYGLQLSEINALANIVAQKRPLQTNDYLYHQGEQAFSLFAVKSGSFKSFISTTDGQEQIIGFYLPGELVGLDALQFGRFTCSTVALETAAVCELPLPSLNDLCATIPGLQAQMTRIMGKEITAVHENILLVGHRTAKERLATFLLMLSTRYIALGFSGTQFNLSMRRQDIANFLGLTIETVSRQLRELSTRGIISIQQRAVVINDLPQLKAIVQPCG